jgi:FAD/FMN-containing dehydrogenase
MNRTDTITPTDLSPPRARSVVSDIHSKLNTTEIHQVVRPTRAEQVRDLVLRATSTGRRISVAGGRHAMGGQQFATGSIHVDTRGLCRVIGLDTQRGLVEVEAGIQWPELIDWLTLAQADSPNPWSIIQKQTGADRLCLGGALSANIHGRGLALKPIIDDVESFRIVDARGATLSCSRSENPDLFRLAIGGYGLFGIIVSITLRLRRREALRRVVRIIHADDLMPAFERRIADGFIYGDFQFSIDHRSPDFMKRGVFSCYRPVVPETPFPPGQKRLDQARWNQFLALAHTDPGRVYDLYTAFYLETDGQIYWSDTHQLSTYVDDYHSAIDRQCGSSCACAGSEMITETYLPRAALPAFLDTLAGDFRQHAVQVIFGTIRLIEKDEQSFLAWAREPWVCVVMNLHVDHESAALEKAACDVRRIIDRAIEFGGSYYLTYHRWATRDQVTACHPKMAEFLEEKIAYDPSELFHSDWYRHHRTLLG